MTGLPWWDKTTKVPTELEASEWDYLRLGGIDLPGILEEPPKAEPGRKVDKKNGAGLDGATLTWHGFEPPEISIKLLLWTAEHWREWQEILPVILPRPGKPPANPFAIDHPALTAYGITQVMVTKISLPEKAGQHGVMRVTITCEHWVKVKNAGTSTPTSAAGAVPKTVHDQQGGYAPALIGPPAAPQTPSQFGPPAPK
jgi:hypothetical protein